MNCMILAKLVFSERKALEKPRPEARKTNTDLFISFMIPAICCPKLSASTPITISECKKTNINHALTRLCYRYHCHYQQNLGPVVAGVPGQRSPSSSYSLHWGLAVSRLSSQNRHQVSAWHIAWQASMVVPGSIPPIRASRDVFSRMQATQGSRAQSVALRSSPSRARPPKEGAETRCSMTRF